MRFWLLLCLAGISCGAYTSAQGQTQVVGEAKAGPEMVEGENAILNPGFEDELASWQAVSKGPGLKAERDNLCSSEGDWSLRLTSASGKSADIMLHQGAVEPGQRYRFSIKYATSTEGAEADVSPAPLVWASFGGQAGTVVDLNWLGTYDAPDWAPLEAEFAAPPDAAVISIRLFVYQQAGTVWFDEAKLCPLLVGGEPMRSTPDGNSLYNADMELGTGDQPHGWMPGSLRAGIHRQWIKYDKLGRHVWSESQPHSGSRCLGCEIRDATKVPYIFWAQHIGIRPSTTYTLSGWLRAEGGSSANLQVVVIEARGLEREVYQTSYVGPGPWRPETVTFTTPKWDGASRTAHVAMVGGNVGSLYVDDIRLEEAAAELEGVDLVIETDKPGNVFPSANETCFTFKLTNNTATPLGVSAKYAVHKQGDNPEWKPLMGQMVLPAGDRQQCQVSKIVKEPGVYTLRVVLSCVDGRALEKQIAFAVGG